MNKEVLVDQFFETLINGDRPAARALVQKVADAGVPAAKILADLLWPTYEQIEKLHRHDQLTSMSHHLATRLLRTLVDQNAANLTRGKVRGRTVFACCGPAEGDELGAQMAVDLLEAGGFTVTFAGGGLPPDEVMSQVHEYRPDVLLMFASAPGDLPIIRQTIDTLHEIGACPKTQIVVGGGVFNRAEGLAEEIGADLWATSPMELVHLMLAEPEHRATDEQRTVGRKRRAKAA
ncbi:MAG: cobalamin-dependent protein [Phycisphaerales bacterium]|nr:cobalamin-dependent protein [Phycisphaerales bacterium]